jgi:hypothetical protein
MTLLPLLLSINPLHSKIIYLFICGLFNDARSSSDCKPMASDDMIEE